MILIKLVVVHEHVSSGSGKQTFFNVYGLKKSCLTPFFDDSLQMKKTQVLTSKIFIRSTFDLK